jgi:hypothetical protein
MLSFLKKHAKTIALVGSLLLNALGGAGVIPPVLADAAGSALSNAAK